MSIPAGLFVDSPEMNDVSLTRLSNEPDQWAEEAVQKLKERIPKSSPLSLMVKFQKKDEESGTATGAIIVSSVEKKAIVPLVIKEFMLYPLDVMIADDKIFPLTPDYFDAVFLNNVLFQRLEEYPIYSGMGRFDNYAVQLNEAIYPPNMGGRYAYASGSYPMLESIAQTINPTELKEFLAKNPGVIANFEKNGTADIVKSITKIQPVNMSEYDSAIRDLIPRNILMVKKMGYDNYSILANSDEVFDPRITKKINRHECMNFISKLCPKPNDFINDVDRNGEKILYPDSEVGNGVYLFEPQVDRVVSATEFGAYKVRKMNGVTVEGWVVPRVINFDMEPQPMKLFIGSTMSTMQPEIAGVRVDSPQKRIHSSMPKVGQTGSLVYEKENRALGTVPLTIASIEILGDCEVKILAQDINGNKLKLKWHIGPSNQGSPSLERFADIAPTGSTPCYLVPDGFKWCPMEGFFEVTSNAADFHVKAAAERITVAPATIIPTGYGYYSVKGLDKYAQVCGFDKTNIPEHGVKFMLASLGVSQDKLGQFLKAASVRGKVDVHGLNRTPLLGEKIASKKGLATRIVKIAEMLKTNLVKEASYIENNQTVDSLLSLNFINPDNLAKFISYLPQFKGTISSLCACLIGSRLGIQEIPEQAVGSALYRLIDVVNGLERLRAIQEHGE